MAKNLLAGLMILGMFALFYNILGAGDNVEPRAEKKLPQLTAVAKKECENVSPNPEDWNCYEDRKEFKKSSASEVTVTVTSYIFLCPSGNCQYKIPAFDGTVVSANKVLAYIGLPEVSELLPGGKKSYTTSNYPLGELGIHVDRFLDMRPNVDAKERDRCSRFLWKVHIVQERTP